jgi:endonuclease I
MADTVVHLFPGDSLALTSDFQPQHNVSYQLPVVIRTGSGFGHLTALLQGQGQYSKSYYQSTANLEGSALRSALANRIASGYNSLGYTIARDNMYASIDNVNGNVECAYTGRTATFNTRAGANANSFNCEHTFPQGFFNQNEPMRSDIHHLFPTDVAANSQRGNDPFGVVSNASWSQGGSKSGGGKFEPRNLQKGATARAMMYFVLRYQDYTNFFQGQQAILYNWHRSFPPSPSEKQRNDDISALQNNRNPFVDYPQYMDRMGALVGSGDLPANYEIYLSDDTIRLARGSFGQGTYNFLLVNRGNRAVKLYDWSTTNSTLSLPSSLDTLKLEPGGYAIVPIGFDSGLNYQNEVFSFSKDLGSLNNFQVPIFSNADFSTEILDINETSLYPNPADDYFQLAGKLKTENRVLLIDSFGRSHSINCTDGRCDVSELPPGLYLLRILNKSGRSRILIR